MIIFKHPERLIIGYQLIPDILLFRLTWAHAGIHTKKEK
jgi:hypothetical protein